VRSSGSEVAMRIPLDCLLGLLWEKDWRLRNAAGDLLAHLVHRRDIDGDEAAHAAALLLKDGNDAAQDAAVQVLKKIGPAAYCQAGAIADFCECTDLWNAKWDAEALLAEWES